MTRSSDIRIESVGFDYEDFLYRTPIKFGGIALDRATLLNVEVTVRTEAGQTVPRLRLDAARQRLVVSRRSARLRRHARRDESRRGAASRRSTATCTQVRPPDRPVPRRWSPSSFTAAGDVDAELQARRADPASLHARRRQPVRRRPARRLRQGPRPQLLPHLRPRFLAHDLGHYLGAEFAGEPLDRYVRREAAGADAAVSPRRCARSADTDADVTKRLDDGLPETLARVDSRRRPDASEDQAQRRRPRLGRGARRRRRPRSRHRPSKNAASRRGATRSTSTNSCANVGYLLEFLRRCRSGAPAASSASSTSSSRRPAT